MLSGYFDHNCYYYKKREVMKPLQHLAISQSIVIEELIDNLSLIGSLAFPR